MVFAGSCAPPAAATVASLFLIDDDDIALESLRALFRLETGHDLACFRDPRQARAALEHTPVDVVISDYLMAGINGIDLLCEARRLQPDAARILLTGFADKENAIRAINEAGLYQYLEKPWDNDHVLMVVRNALAEKNLRRELALKVKKLDQLLWEHTQLAERHGYLTQEMEMAERVQHSLLPSASPQVPGFHIETLYRTCQSLGGDFFDFAWDGARLFGLVADVSGHGAQAALTSMLLKAAFHDGAAQSSRPDELLARMNPTLHRFLPEGMFVAAAVLLLAPPSPRVLLSNAGLPRPYVLRASKQQVDQVVLVGAPLGIFPGEGLEPYETREIHLAPGDLLLLSTDGLGEASNSEGEHFQDRQLVRTLHELSGRARLLQALFDAARRFHGGDNLPDDVALVSVEAAPR